MWNKFEYFVKERARKILRKKLQCHAVEKISFHRHFKLLPECITKLLHLIF